ncbi:stealth conserved region 3 domain-containing protein [Streptomyces sp. NPDC018964]|uniref:stealth conserved region 3 domain-containing protein n=1 Tax=unclassified Streptomyces TaxID=2593676 RepID=UPI00379A522C
MPQQRGALRALEELFPEEVARTTASRFRSPRDIAMTAPLLYQYALMTGRGVPGRFSYRYVNINRPDAEQRLADLHRSRRFDFFCLNHVDTAPEARAEARRGIRDFLERKYPFPSRFERAPAPASGAAAPADSAAASRGVRTRRSPQRAFDHHS